MTPVLIGSLAAQYHRIDLGREPADIDLVMTDADRQKIPTLLRESVQHKGKFHGTMNGSRIEIDATDTEANRLLLQDKRLQIPRVVDEVGMLCAVPTINVLWLIKRSHAGHDIQWEKTMRDLRVLGQHIAPFSRIEMEFYRLHKADCDARYKHGVRNWNVPNEQFFKPHVKRQFHHDFLHSVVKYGEVEMYKRIKHDLSMAKCHRDLFEALTADEQFMCVREETMAIALERFLIPEKVLGHIQAYEMARRHLCLSLARGWFQDFIIDNWFDRRMRCDRNYWNLFVEETKEQQET